MPGSDADAAKNPQRWDTLGAGADLWATVVMAAGFVLAPDQEVREHYRIVRPLGKGGMGQVLGVTLQGSPDEQLYALKMVARPNAPTGEGAAADPADRHNAELQARAFAALLRGEAAKQELVQRHGVSVARLFALVRFEDGALGLRMEVARGHSLETFLEAEARDRGDAAPDLDYCLVVARKLMYQLRRLHELVDPSSPAGFVHSDVKPGNVFVDDGDRYDPYITLLDFGVATAGHALDIDPGGRGAGRKSLILQSAGGTFGYAPPHHFTGKPTPLSDVYAALVILYELIALRAPWDFGDLAKTPANVFKLDDAMRAGPRPVRASRPGIPAEVAAALDRFFAEEFRALQSLADAAHDARRSEDEGVRRAMADRLRGLAQSYQGKIDALRAELTGARVSSEPPQRVSDSTPAVISSAPTPAPVVNPTPTPVPTPAPAPPRKTPRPPPRRVSAREDAPRVPMQPLIGWKTYTAIALLAAGAWVFFMGLPAPLDEVARNTLGWPGADAGATDASAVVDAGRARDAGTDASRDARVRDASREAATVVDTGVDTGVSPMVLVVDSGALAADDVQDVASVVEDDGVRAEDVGVSPDVFQGIARSVDASGGDDVALDATVDVAVVVRDSGSREIDGGRGLDAATAGVVVRDGGLDAGMVRDGAASATARDGGVRDAGMRDAGRDSGVRVVPAVRVAPAVRVLRRPPPVRRAPPPARRGGRR